MGHEYEKHRRRSIRLKGYDYSQPGAYFVTICTRNKEYLFGEIIDGKMMLNKVGEIVRDEWNRIPRIHKNAKLDEYVIMPNHLHGVIMITDALMVSWQRVHKVGSFGKPVSGSLPTIIRCCKAAITSKINELRQTPGLPVWQRNYYEHVTRGGEDLNEVREYIINNPLK